MTIEDMLRETVAPGTGSDPALEERVRREAMAALSGMRRRHRVRRAVSVAAAAAGIGAIAGFFVFALPRGGDARVPATQAGPNVSLFERAERPGDRVGGDAWRFGVRGGLTRIRRGVEANAVRYFAAVTTEPAMLCVLAEPDSGPGSSACSDPEVLRRVGALTYFRQGGPANTSPVEATTRLVFLVPDGIERVRVGRGEAAVRDNMASIVIRGAAPKTMTLLGPAATDVRPDGGPDWERGTEGRTAFVTVPLSPGSNDSILDPTPIEDVRLVAPASAPAGSVIALRVVTPRGLGGDAGFGVDARLDRREGDRWVPAYHLNYPLTDTPGVPAAVPVDTPNFGWVAIGLGGGAPYPVRLPSVPPGRYRISKDVNRLGASGLETRTVTAEITITPDAVTLPESPGVPVDRSAAEVVAMDSDGTRVWRAPARPEASPPGSAGTLTCWFFLGGTDCTDGADLARSGGFAMTFAQGDGSWRAAVVAAPGATAIRIAGQQRLMVNGVAFADGLRTGRPDVEVVFRGGATKRFR